MARLGAGTMVALLVALAVAAACLAVPASAKVPDVGALDVLAVGGQRKCSGAVGECGVDEDEELGLGGRQMGVGLLHTSGRWGSCPTLPYGELRLYRGTERRTRVAPGETCTVTGTRAVPSNLQTCTWTAPEEKVMEEVAQEGQEDCASNKAKKVKL